MIYNYEGEFLRWVNSFIPEIKLMTYSSDEELLTALDKIKELPAFYYSRTDMNIQWNKTVQVPADYDNTSPPYRFYPYLQKYTGTIIVENQSAAFKIITKLKLGFNNDPSLLVKIPGVYANLTSGKEDISVRVSLFLTGISVEDVALPNNKNGAMRAVRFTWQSQMLISDSPESYNGFVEQVHLGYAIVEYVDANGKQQPMNTKPFNHPVNDPVRDPEHKLDVYRENGYILIQKTS